MFLELNFSISFVHMHANKNINVLSARVFQYCSACIKNVSGVQECSWPAFLPLAETIVLQKGI